MEEHKEQMTNADGKHNEVKKAIPDRVKPSFRRLHESVQSMPNYIRTINAQREKEKGNEVSNISTISIAIFDASFDCSK